MKRKLLAICVLLLLVAAVGLAQEAAAPATEAALKSAQSSSSSSMWKYISAAVAVSAGCIGGGLAVGQVGAAAMGAMSEHPELSGKAIPYAGLAEGIALWGFLVALFIILL